jgi:hypothetical protein
MVSVNPGDTSTVTLTLDDRAFACWDPGDAGGAAIQERLPGSPFADPAEAGWRIAP